MGSIAYLAIKYFTKVFQLSTNENVRKAVALAQIPEIAVYTYGAVKVVTNTIKGDELYIERNKNFGGYYKEVK